MILLIHLQQQQKNKAQVPDVCEVRKICCASAIRTYYDDDKIYIICTLECA